MMAHIPMPSAERNPALIVTIGRRACAIGLQHVAETMRPLAIETMSGMPEFVRGVSVVRGTPMPVVDLQVLLETGEHSAACGRFVTVKVGERRVALAVDGVVGVRHLDSAQIGELPPLLRDIDADLVEAIGTCDAQLLLVLRAARIVPDDVWATLATGTEAR
jgi:purine-binding chemotaxis protein CheW